MTGLRGAISGLKCEPNTAARCETLCLPFAKQMLDLRARLS
jgi:hypothetical protein